MESLGPMTSFPLNTNATRQKDAMEEEPAIQVTIPLNSIENSLNLDQMELATAMWDGLVLLVLKWTVPL